MRFVRLFAVVATTAFTALSAVEGAQDAGLAGVVGNWRNVNDGGAAFKVDTAGWSGTTSRASLEAHAKSLFGTVNDTFIANGASPQAFPLAVHTSTTSFTGGTVRVQFKLVGGIRDWSAGIVFDLKPNGEYHYVRYNTLDGNVAVWRYRNGDRERVSMGEIHKQLPLNAWHELVLTVRGNRLTVGVEGTEVKHEYTLPSAVSGRVGLWTKREAVTVFRNFRVTP